jgi:hypothetical protein
VSIYLPLSGEAASKAASMEAAADE